MAFWKRAAWGIVAAILAVPAALMVTLILSPFWNWFESVSGIESMGHSGPGNWCFVAVYAVFLVIISVVASRRRAESPKP